MDLHLQTSEPISITIIVEDETNRSHRRFRNCIRFSGYFLLIVCVGVGIYFAIQNWGNVTAETSTETTQPGITTTVTKDVDAGTTKDFDGIWNPI